MYRKLKYWLQLGRDYGYRRQGIHLWRRWRDPEHDRIECVCCCTDCDIDEELGFPMAKLHEGLRHVSASSLTLSLIMDDGDAVHLAGVEVSRVLTEVAKAAPALLHDALERRLVSLIATEVRYQMTEGELQCPHGRNENRCARCAASR